MSGKCRFRSRIDPSRVRTKPTNVVIARIIVNFFFTYGLVFFLIT